MPLTGELEHLPIVDVIQLIHSTRKSGTLNVYSRKGEGQLVFNNGYIVSATHSSERLKIGKILLESNIITKEDLDRALGIQGLAEEDRKPLIATLLDHCGLSKDAAFKALETLIEMTVVEMISWARGIFTLDVDEVSVSDDYRYLPKQLQTVSLDTQMVLMDALRIFDEKVHAGEIEISEEPLDSHSIEQMLEPPEDQSISTAEAEDIVVSEDILGLANLDKIERKKPHVFKGLEAFDPAQIHRQVIDKYLGQLSVQGKDILASYMAGISTTFLGGDGIQAATAKSQAVIIYTCDEFLQHSIMTVCKKEGILVFVTSNRHEIDNLIDRALYKYLEPVLVFGPPSTEIADFSKETIVGERSLKMVQYPQISILQLASPLDFTFSLQSLNDGTRAVLPMPYYSERPDSYAEDMVTFLDTFQSYIRSCFNEERRMQFAKLRNSLSGLRLLRKAPDISLLVLQFVSEVFERSLTLIVDKNDLIAERSIGIHNDKGSGPSAPMKFRVPIRKDSTFKKVIKSGEPFLGKSDDTSFSDLLYPKIETPKDSTVMLLPLKSNDRIITLTYADFGDLSAKQVSLDFLEFFVGQAGLAMENALFRKQLNHAKPSQEKH
jgi:Domain of unknown function (DUF4388)